MIINYISLFLRITSLLLIILKVIPAQINEFNIEDNGLRTLKFYLLMLGITFFLLTIFPITYDICHIAGYCTGIDLLETKTIANSMNTFTGSIMLYLIYLKKY